MELRSKTKLRKIGTSYGVIIPKSIVDLLKLEGKQFDIVIQENNVIKLIVDGNIVKSASKDKAMFPVRKLKKPIF